MNIFKKYQPIYRDATVLLRPRTPLKDMYLALDPGTPTRRRGPERRRAQRRQHEPDINVDQILSSLDADTRNYLLLLLSGGAQAFHEPRGNGRGAQPHRGAPTCGACSSASRR